MKAVVCTAYGAPDQLVLKDVEKPVPKSDEVLLRILSCGINFPDTLIIRGKYQFRPEPPFTPGAEVCAIIEEVGSEVKGFAVGDRVAAGIIWGGLAEYATAKPFNMFKIPEGIRHEIAAGSLMTYGTTYHALVDRGGLVKGDKLLVLGAAGGLGTAAIQIGKYLGAHVIAAASSEQKLEYASHQGADVVFNYSHGDLKSAVKEMTDGKGVDIIYDPVGDHFTEQAFRALAIGGRHLILGFAGGEIPKIPMNLPLLKQASLVGVFWSGFWQNNPEQNRSNIQKIWELIVGEQLDPQVVSSYHLETAWEAIQALEDRQVLGKIVVEVAD